MKKYLLNAYNILNEIAIDTDDRFLYILKEKHKYNNNVFIDYAIIEKNKNIYGIISDFGLDDIESRYALERCNLKDLNNNIYM